MELKVANCLSVAASCLSAAARLRGVVTAVKCEGMRASWRAADLAWAHCAAGGWPGGGAAAHAVSRSVAAAAMVTVGRCRVEYSPL